VSLGGARGSITYKALAEETTRHARIACAPGSRWATRVTACCGECLCGGLQDSRSPADPTSTLERGQGSGGTDSVVASLVHAQLELVCRHSCRSRFDEDGQRDNSRQWKTTGRHKG